MDTNEKRKFLIKISVLVLILLILVLVFTLLIKKQKENKTEISESTSESAFTFSNASTTFSSLFSNAVPETAETSETEPETTAPTLIVTGTTVPETSETEPETVEETSTEETSQDDETLWDTEAGIADTEEETKADETKETIKETTEPETTQEETVSERKFDKYTNVVIIGDSRTVQMAKAMNAETVEEHQNPNYGGVFRNGKYIFVCENSAGAEWLDGTGFTEAKPYIRATTAVVFWLGVNDTGNSSDAISASVNNYISLIQEQLDNVGCDIFYVSVGPCTGKWEYWNLYTEEFNRDMNKQLKNATWIEVYDMLTAGLAAGDYQTDSSGVHYSVNAYKDIFYMIYYKTPVDSTELSPGDSAQGGIGYTTG